MKYRKGCNFVDIHYSSQSFVLFFKFLFVFLIFRLLKFKYVLGALLKSRLFFKYSR